MTLTPWIEVDVDEAMGAVGEATGLATPDGARMTDAQRTRLRALLARGLFFPEARELARLILSIDARNAGKVT